jgi:positive regulator of sigma E activity
MKSGESYRTIDHEGIVQKNSGKSVLVNILAESACSGCHAEGSCMLSKKEEKVIEIQGIYEVSPGDTVRILMKPSTGIAALFFGYILPLFIVVFMLITMNSVGLAELYAGLISIAILLPYYLSLFLFRKQLNKKFTFSLKV